MKINITSRDIKFIVIGVITAFIFVTIYDWEDNVKAFKEATADGKIDYEKSKY
ncbi:hypothetical protein SAMN04487764_2751 [Gillisia sp. Hel1_33_143]|uniref:hypothetical protein n=1 Tax=Gillisia sp. Hel1_33_143 TaxID=1336796 RepID=UPI000879E0E7|nr:hypothetical protein [Gillisia sp. Hel1_33_143]SDS66514.1 hypothetical protein SAMN04487764_2751 [Gillisia sp. Hel1_33_143]